LDSTEHNIINNGNTAICNSANDVNKIKISKRLPPTEAGVTVCYNENDIPFELAIAEYPVDTVIKKKNGFWYFDAEESGFSEEKTKMVQNIEDFYYETKNILPYHTYQLVISQHPNDAFLRFKKNPFFVLDLDEHISFIDYDKLLPISCFEHRIHEMKYAIRSILEQNEKNGHTLMQWDDFCNRLYRLMKTVGHDLTTEQIYAYVNYYNDEFYHEDRIISFLSTYKKEVYIRNSVKTMIATQNYAGFSHKNNENLSEEQNAAVYKSVSGSNLSILTGGPGTGKTTTLLDLVSSFNEEYPSASVVLLAPTGKAGRRIKEVFKDLNVSIYTIHYFLGLGRFKNERDIKRIQSANFIIIDESSMIGVDLFYNLLINIDVDKTKILLVGDVDQLPSVEAGNLLMDLIDFGVNTVYLTQNFRSNSSIHKNAQDINAGIPLLVEDECFHIQELGNDFLSPFFPAVNTDALLTPFRKEYDAKGNLLIGSCISANAEIHRQRYPGVKGYAATEPIIINHTNYKNGYINGETGTAIKLTIDGLFVSIDGKERLISNMDDVSLGYAITVHKSQGSEYDKVTICLPQGVSSFFTRQMLYTAVTRAAQSIEIIGDRKEIAKVIANKTKQQRQTFFALWNKTE